MKCFSVLVFFFSVAPLALADTLKFDQAIEQILMRSTDMSTQRAQISETVATNIPARTAFLPNLGVQLSRYANQDNALTTKTEGDSVNATAKLNLFRFGSDVKGWEAASGDEDTQTLKLADTILKTEQTAVQALVAEIQGIHEIEVLSGIVKEEQQLLKIARERFARGLLAQQEVDKINVDMENANAHLADTQIREAISRANLVSLLGNSEVDSNWPWIDRLRGFETDIKKRQTLFGSEEDILKRPDVKSAQSNLEAQENRSSQRVRQILPTLDSSFTYSSYGLITQPAGTTYDPQWIAALTITIPIFDQLSNYSNARIQYFEVQKADVALEQARRNAMSDWTASKDAFELSLKTASSREKTAQVSRKLYGDSLQRFRLGHIDANSLALDATRLSDSELLATAGWAQVHLAFAQLCHSRGRRISECF